MNTKQSRKVAAPVAQAAPSTRLEYDLLISEAEGRALETMRLWTRAQSKPSLLANLDTWESLRLAVSYAEDGDMEGLASFASGDAELVALATLLAGYVERATNDLLAGENERYKEGAL